MKQHVKVLLLTFIAFVIYISLILFLGVKITGKSVKQALSDLTFDQITAITVSVLFGTIFLWLMISTALACREDKKNEAQRRGNSLRGP